MSEVDVLVLGFGAAGASAAIAARDAGASVLIAEKMAYGGGNCLNSGGFLFDVDGPQAVDHLDALCFGKTPRAVLAAFVEGLHDLPAWLASLGGATAPVDVEAFAGMLPSWPHFPGAGHISYSQFVAGDAQGPGPALFGLLRKNMERRGIEVRYRAPASQLLVEDGGHVTGAVVSGEPVEARSVILAAGGFEYDAELRDTYLPLPLVPVGHPGNTGDALRLATQAGASLWHMSAFFGWFAFRHPDHLAAFPLDVHAPSFIYVDADGRRFADETGWELHDKVRSLTAYLPRRRNYPHMSGHLVFDEAARLAGPLNGVVGTPNHYVWSADNSAEVASGWIKRGDTADELADLIGAPELPATLARYGAQPDELGRAPETIVPLEAPLYAIEMRPGVATASGGPRRDEHARVLRRAASRSRGCTPLARREPSGATSPSTAAGSPTRWSSAGSPVRGPHAAIDAAARVPRRGGVRTRECVQKIKLDTHRHFVYSVAGGGRKRTILRGAHAESQRPHARESGLRNGNKTLSAEPFRV